MKPLLLGLLIPVLVSCRPESPEAQVRWAFQASVKSVETGNAAEAASVLAQDFSGPEGMDKASARLFLMGILKQGKVGITVLENRVIVQGSRAEQSVNLLLTSRGGSGLLPDETSRRLFLLSWERQGRHWKLRELKEN